MVRVMDETKVEEHFTEHDLQAKCASDAAAPEHARQLLPHADGKITEKVCRRRPEVIKPLRQLLIKKGSDPAFDPMELGRRIPVI